MGSLFLKNQRVEDFLDERYESADKWDFSPIK